MFLQLSWAASYLSCQPTHPDHSEFQQRAARDVDVDANADLWKPQTKKGGEG